MDISEAAVPALPLPAALGRKDFPVRQEAARHLRAALLRVEADRLVLRVASSHGAYAPHACSDHVHGHPELFLQLSGACRFTVPGGDIELRAGELLVMPSGVPHAELARPPVADFCNLVFMPTEGRLGLHFAAAAGHRPYVRQPLRCGDRAKPGLDELAEGLVAGREGLAVEEARRKGLAIAWLAQALQAVESAETSTGVPARIAAARAHLRARWMETDLRVAAIAQQVGLHPDHLAAGFRKAYGETPLACVQRLRLDAARHLLARGTLSVAAVARAVGYRDAAYFSRAFQRQTGVPPSRWGT
jgi:AraC-like DNA-binding protein